MASAATLATESARTQAKRRGIGLVGQVTRASPGDRIGEKGEVGGARHR